MKILPRSRLRLCLVLSDEPGSGIAYASRKSGAARTHTQTYHDRTPTVHSTVRTPTTG